MSSNARQSAGKDYKMPTSILQQNPWPKVSVKNYMSAKAFPSL